LRPVAGPELIARAASDGAYATRSVLHVMAGIMATAAVVAFVGLRAGVQEETDATGVDVEAEAEVSHAK
jgi:hypothetical protein